MNNNTKAVLRVLKSACGGVASRNKLIHLSGFTIGVVTRCIEQMLRENVVSITSNKNSKAGVYIELINNEG